ncbi:MAG: hypothetical protein ACKOEY_17070, partial [Phenylobacterium sp.]
PVGARVRPRRRRGRRLGRSIGRLILTAGLSPDAAQEALERRLDRARGVSAAAFPAIAHAALARARAAGRRPSALGDRLRLMRAVLTGRV